VQNDITDVKTYTEKKKMNEVTESDLTGNDLIYFFNRSSMRLIHSKMIMNMPNKF